MKVALGKQNDTIAFFAIDDGGSAWPIFETPASSPSSMGQFIKAWLATCGRLERAGGPAIPATDLQFLPPVMHPEKVICVGRNYKEHADEMKSEVGDLPVIFNKLPSSLIGHEQPIELPDISNQVDYEAELVIVIGKPGRNIPRSEAINHVFGYTCGNDISARDWQKHKPGGQWLLGKTFDTFAPLGPWIVTADEIEDPSSLSVQLTLNGTVMQQGRVADLIFDIEYLIWHLSRFCTLRPGDLIFTGTPSGVGVARNPQVFLQDGDRVEVAIDGIGVLANPVIARKM